LAAHRQYPIISPPLKTFKLGSVLEALLGQTPLIVKGFGKFRARLRAVPRFAALRNSLLPFSPRCMVDAGRFAAYER
jgi:hypothetical protein